MHNQPLLAHWQNLAGSALGPGEWFCIDQQRISAFADATLDHQIIHIDPQAPASKKMGGTIAHGFLSLSLLSHLTEQLTASHTQEHTVLNYGINKLRFINPVACDADIRLHISVDNVETKPQGVLVTLNDTIEIKGLEKPALVAEHLLLILYH